MKIEAELLVKCGYADYKTENDNYICWHDPEIDNTMVAVQPYADTLEGRRQLDALEDYFSQNYGIELWAESVLKLADTKYKSERQWRIDRIKWCCEQLSGREE